MELFPIGKMEKRRSERLTVVPVLLENGLKDFWVPTLKTLIPEGFEFGPRYAGTIYGDEANIAAVPVAAVPKTMTAAIAEYAADKRKIQTLSPYPRNLRSMMASAIKAIHNLNTRPGVYEIPVAVRFVEAKDLPVELPGDYICSGRMAVLIASAHPIPAPSGDDAADDPDANPAD